MLGSYTVASFNPKPSPWWQDSPLPFRLLLMYTWAQHSVSSCSSTAALVAHVDVVVGLSSSRVGLNVTEHEGGCSHFMIWFMKEAKVKSVNLVRKWELFASLHFSFCFSLSLRALEWFIHFPVTDLLNFIGFHAGFHSNHKLQQAIPLFSISPLSKN